MKDFLKPLEKILAELDDANDGDEMLEEISAELEDAIFMLKETDEDDEDFLEAWEDALDDFEAMNEDLEDLPEIQSRFAAWCKLVRAELERRDT